MLVSVRFVHSLLPSDNEPLRSTDRDVGSYCLHGQPHGGRTDAGCSFAEQQRHHWRQSDNDATWRVAEERV